MQHQHYISQLLLRNFSPEGKKGLINILIKPDKELLDQSIAKHAASEINYNTINSKGNDNNELEKIASKLEAQVGKIFKKLKKSNYIISLEELSVLLYYGAFLFVNVPHFRKNIGRFKKDVYEGIMEMLSSDLNLLKNTLNKTNIPNKEEIDVKKLAESYLNGDIKIETSKEDIVITAINQVKTVYDILIKMYWCFYIINDDAFYITSDIPLIAVDKNFFKLPYHVGFINAEAVFFPISKKACLVGQWKGFCNNVGIDGSYANGVNVAMLKYSNQLYMPFTQKELIEQFNRYNY